MSNSEFDPGRTVGEVAALLGVTVRTLHHWEECGLVVPRWRTSGNHRLYSRGDVVRAQQVLVYRATGMGLSQIGELLDAGGSAVSHLQRQRRLLVEKVDAVQAMISAVDRLLEDVMSVEPTLSVEDVAEILGDADFPAHQVEAEQKWGGTAQWEESQRAVAAMGRGDWVEFRQRQDSLEEALGRACAEGCAVDSPEVAELVEQHRRLLSHFYEVTYARHVLLARMYTEDPRFCEHYERVTVGLAQWLREAIEANAAAHGVDVDAAQWDGCQ